MIFDTEKSIMLRDKLIALANNPIGMALLAALVVLTTSTSFRVFFRPSKQEEDVTNDPLLQDAYLEYLPYQPKATWSSHLKVLKAMYFSKIAGDNDLQEFLNSFYHQQADLYD
jgi:hypothetical protein